MVAIIASNGRLLVDNMEFRSISIDVEQTRVFSVARIARAVNCGALETRVIEMTAHEVAAASIHSSQYVVKPYASSLTSVTAKIPLLLYEDNRGVLVLLDGRQRAAKACEIQDHIKAYVVSEADAVSVGVHPFSSETVQLFNLIKNPIVREKVAELLGPLRHMPLLSPILDKLRKEAEASGETNVLATLDRLAATMEAQDDYKLLKSTRPHPVVFDQKNKASAGGTNEKRVAQIVHYESRKRPKDGSTEQTVKAFYGFHALEATMLEDLVQRKASQLKVAVGPYRGMAGLVLDDYEGKNDGRTLSERRSDAYDQLLQRHWRHIRLLHDGQDNDAVEVSRPSSVEDDRRLYPYFGVILQNAGAIIQAASSYRSLDDLRSTLKKRVDLVAENGDEALRELRDCSAERLHLYAKALIRMRHWRSAKIDLLDMENGTGAVEPTDVAMTARRDLDRKPSLVRFDEMCTFSYQTGVPATAIWPLHLAFNPFFECTALVLAAATKGPKRPVRLTPTAIEMYLHRRAIQDSGETDGMSMYWEDLFKALDKTSLTRAYVAKRLLIIDEKKGLDRFDREENPYGKRI